MHYLIYGCLCPALTARLGASWGLIGPGSGARVTCGLALFFGLFRDAALDFLPLVLSCAWAILDASSRPNWMAVKPSKTDVNNKRQNSSRNYLHSAAGSVILQHVIEHQTTLNTKHNLLRQQQYKTVPLCSNLEIRSCFSNTQRHHHNNHTMQHPTTPNYALKFDLYKQGNNLPP